MALTLPLVTATAFVFLVPAAASPSSALDVTGQSRTYLQSRETTNASRLLPLFEYLDLRARDIGSPAASFNFGGWVRYDQRDDSMPGKDRNSDLQYAYLSLNRSRSDALLQLGRVPVSEGATFELVDGAHARTSLRGGFTLSAFGGRPTETDFDDSRGDSLYGGRISQGVDDWYRIGVTYLRERNDRVDYRKENAVDVWLRPFSKLDVAGASRHNALTKEWMRHDYQATLGPFGPIALRTSWQQVRYGDYFAAATTTAFKLDPAIIDPDEKLSSLGEEVSFTLGDLIATADYRKYSYTIAGDARSVGGRLSYAALQNGAGAAYRRMAGQTDRLRYAEYRAYAYTAFLTALGRIKLAADYLLVRYDEELNGTRNGSAATLALTTQIAAATTVGADIAYEKNPFYDRDVRGMLKLIQVFDLAPAPRGRK